MPTLKSEDEEWLAAHNARMNAEADAQWRAAHPEVETSMPHVSQMMVAKYLNKNDFFHGPVKATIRGVAQDMPRPGSTEEQKWLMYFHELKKALKLNNTTLKYLETTLGPQSDVWIGKLVILYVDPTVQMAGQVVGGVRLRVAKSSLPGAAAAAAVQARFDPLTGQPLAQPTAAPVARFDPMTGQPIQPPIAAQIGAGAGSATTFAISPPAGTPGGYVDATTGEHVSPSDFTRDPDFDDDIPF